MISLNKTPVLTTETDKALFQATMDKDKRCKFQFKAVKPIKKYKHKHKYNHKYSQPNRPRCDPSPQTDNHKGRR